MRQIEVTLTGSKQQITTARIMTPFVVFQNNDATNSVTIGDNTVTATKGIVLAKGGTTFTVQRADNNINLSLYYVIGTAASKLEILYE